MQPTTRIKNKNTPWTALLRPRVTDVVVSSGGFYVNLTGYNAPLTDTNVWLAFSNPGSALVLPIEKTSANIAGTDPGFYIDLSANIAETYPASIKVYVNNDITAPGNQFVELSPLTYYPDTKRLFGFNDPSAFPNQAIKIFVI